MADVTTLVARVRRELGDLGQPFRDSFTGTGEAGDYDLTETQITTATVDAVDSVGLTHLVETTDFTIDLVDGRLFLFGVYNPLPVGTTLLINWEYCWDVRGRGTNRLH